MLSCGTTLIGIAVDTMSGPVRSFRPRLATGGYLRAELARADSASLRLQIHQHPVREIHPRQVRRHLAAFLVYVVTEAGHIRIVTDEYQRSGPHGKLGPGQVGIAIRPQVHMILGVGHAEGVLSRDGLAVGDGVGG